MNCTKVWVSLSGLTLIAFLLAGGAYARDDGSGTREATRISWLELREAQRVSKETGKPILIVSGAKWCKHCRKLNETTLAKPGVAKFVNKNFIAVHLDTDRDKKITRGLKVRKFPTTQVFDSDGKLLTQFTGYRDPKPFVAELKKSLQPDAAQQASRSQEGEPSEKGGHSEAKD
jgi:thioredoxin-like negative regulator of GroEL